jgi:GH24 family phage-related lysozyme (muramidase)
MSTVNRSELTSASFWLDALEGVVQGNSDPLCKLSDGAKALAGWITDGLEPAPRSPLPRSPVPSQPSPLPPPPPPPPAAAPAATSTASSSSASSSAPAGALSPEELVDDLLRWEGYTENMYVDTRGFVTVGIGNMLPSAEAAKKLPFIDAKTGKPATPEQIEAAFAAVARMRKGMSADKYAAATTLRLPESTVRQLASDRLKNEFLPALRRMFPGFDSFPASAQQALVDMAYNLGTGGLAKFKNLRAACEAGDWARAATECSRSTSRPARNEWTRQMFLEAAAAS